MNDELMKKCLNALPVKAVTKAIYTKKGKLYPTAFYRLRKAQIVVGVSIIRQEVIDEIVAMPHSTTHCDIIKALRGAGEG